MAIAFDATSEGTVGADPSWSHTCSGADRLLIVLTGRTTDVVAGVTYNGVAMTSITETTYPGSGYAGLQLWYLVAPSTGSNTIAVDSGGNNGVSGFATSFTGVSQTSPIDSSNVNNNAVGTNSLTVSTTVVGSGCWLVGGCSNNSGTGVGGGTGTTVRNDNAFGVAMGDSNAIVGTGSQSLIFTFATSNLFRGIVASIAPTPFTPKIIIL